MGGRLHKSRRGPRAQSSPLGHLRSALFAWIAIFAVLLQIGAGPLHRVEMKPAEFDARAALGALVAAFGPNVVLCLNEDGAGPGSPTHDSHERCDGCAICQQGGSAAALVPSGHALPMRIARAIAAPSVATEANVARLGRAIEAQPRAPPVLA